jgi:hypothetical protein
MALAAADITRVATFRFLGAKRLTLGYWTPSGTYTSGGEDLTIAISQSKLEMRNVQFMMFSPLFNAAVSAFGLSPVFDGTRTATSNGKIHILNAVAAHVHSFLVKGGQAAAGTDAISIKGSTPVTIGKEAATDATNIGGAGGGVQSNTAVTGGTEVAAGTDFTTGTFKAWFIALGTG